MASLSLKDKIPPHNDEAERATLGALLLDSSALAVVLKYLRPDDFYQTASKRVFQAIINLFTKGEVIDLLTVTEQLRRDGELESCGGPAYVASLTSAVPSSANVEYYARIVQGGSVRRELLRIASEIVVTAHDDSADSRVIIDEAERKIFEITDKQQINSYKSARELVSRAIEVIERHSQAHDEYTGIPSGFKVLDDMTSGFQKSEFIVIGARPSIGKTALATTMAAHIAIKLKVPVGFFTLEMSSMALLQRLLAAEGRIDSKKIRSGILKPADFSKLTEAAAAIYDAPLFIDDSPNMKLLDLRAQARRMKVQERVEIIFIDYIGLIEPETKGNVPRHEQVAEISRSIKALARELEIPVVTLSQVGRQVEGKEPTLADLRESGSIEQDADVVIFLHRLRESDKDAEQNRRSFVETDLIIAKQRNGPVGMGKIAFLPSYTKFEPLSAEPE